jgi:DNA-binding transcriptional LysR family regulator
MPAVPDLSILLELRHARSFSAAANRLGVAHTTVARRLRELEAHFGTPLTQRSGDRIVLTEAGTRAAEVAEQIELDVAALERGISGHNDRASGPITLTTIDILAWRYMPVFATFTAAFPEIELDIGTSLDVLSLARRDADVALRMTNSPPDTLHGRVIERFDFMAYAARTAPEIELSAHRWLDYRSHECAARAAEWLRQQANGAHPRIYVPTPLMMLWGLKRGMGAGMLPSVIGDADKSLRRLSDIPAFSIDVWLLAPGELRRTARVRALFEAFEPRRVANDLRSWTG